MSLWTPKSNSVGTYSYKGKTVLSFSFGRKRKTARGLVGLGIEARGLALAHVVRDDEGCPELRCCEFVEESSETETESTLAQAVERNDLAGSPCVCTLQPGSYTLRLAERPPNIPEDELRDSARWIVRDLLDFDPNDAAVEVFEFPEEATRGRTPKMYVVAVRRETIARAVETVERAGLTLEAIDIPELALRNLISELPEVVAGTALLKLDHKSSLLALYHQDHLYLSRGIGVDAAALDANLEPASADGDELPLGDHGLLDSLLLEIQRSLDYYESEIRKAPASRLLIAPADCETSLLVPTAADLLRPMVVSTLDLSEVLPTSQIIPEHIQAQCLSAVGAALGRSPVQQLDLRGTKKAAAPIALSFGSLLRLMAGTAVALVLLAGAGLWQKGEQLALLHTLEAERNQVQTRIQDFRQHFPTPTRDPDFKRRIDELQAQQRAKSRLISELERSRLAPEASFSAHLEGLARHPVKGLWLTRVRIRDAGQVLALEGKALSPKRLPTLLRELAAEPALAGKSFGVLHMTHSADESGTTEFTLRSRDEEEVSQSRGEPGGTKR